MKKAKQPTTTESYYYDEDFLYEYYGGPHENWQYDYEGPFDFDTNDVIPYFTAFQTVQKIACFVGFFFGILHLIILCRKELRTNFIFIIMIAICISDLFVFSFTIIEVLLEASVFYQVEEDCVGGRPYYHVMTLWIGMTIHEMSRQCSAILAIFMAGFRAVSVMFPMNIGGFMKPRFAIFVILFFMGCCGGWNSIMFRRLQLEKLEECPSMIPTTYERYQLSADDDFEPVYYLTGGIFALFLSIFYVLITSVLVYELRRAQQRRKSLRSDKPDKTNKLVILMATSFFISECGFGAVFVIDQYLNEFAYFQWHARQFYVIPQTLLTINSVLHSFICFFMSSQYRDTLKAMVWKNTTESMIFVVEPSNTTKTSKTRSF